MNTLLLAAAMLTPAADLSGGYDRPASSSQKVSVAGLDDYQSALTHVRAGGTAVLVVGLTAELVTGTPATPVYRCSSLRDYEDGVYDCWCEGGEPVMRRRPTPVTATWPLTSQFPSVFPRCTGPNCR